MLVGRRSRHLFAAVLFLGLNSQFASAQNTNAGEIRGTVTDPSGAVIPGVAITIVNTDTGIAKELLTNAAGLYDAVSILPGKYALTFRKDGFEKLQRTGIELSVGISTVDARLTIGAATQEVQVNAQAPLLQTETGKQSTDLKEESMMQLPNVGQNWTNFTKMLPGVVGSGTSIAVNGNMKYEDNWLSDGGNITNPHSSNVTTGIFENIAEVQMNTSSFDAQYGFGGAVLNQISKSGTNRFHGAGYDYLQNNFFNARSYFSPKVSNLRRNDYGGAVGGPILKDKWFFYFNTDRLIQNSVSYPFYTYPTADMRAGNFSNPIFPTIYDPQSLSNGARTPFPNNTIPGNRIDPVAAAIQSYFPAPNLAGYTNNWLGPLVSPPRNNHYFGRMDYNISSKNRLSGTVNQLVSSGYSATPDCPADCTLSGADAWEFQVTDVHTFSATTINEFRFAFRREFDWDEAVNQGQGFPKKLGINYAVADVFPDVSIAGPVGGTSIGTGTNAILGQNSFVYSDVVTMIHGRHIIKIGGEIDAFQDNTNPWGNLHSASFTFGQVFSQSAPFAGKSGLGYADFLTGSVQAWSASNQPVTGAREKMPQVFVQDDYKILPNLTLNLGLRYELFTGWSEVNGYIGLFDPTLMNPGSNTLGAMWYQGKNGRNTIQAPVRNQFLPRVGFAWSPSSQLAVRGGFGVYDYLWSTDVYANNSGGGVGYGAGVRGSLSNSDQVSPLFQMSASNPPLNTVYANLVPETPQLYNGQNVRYLPYHTPIGHAYQWNFSVQRQLPGGMMAQAAYVGNKGTNLSNPSDLNQVTQANLGKPNPQSNRPYPQYLSIGADNFNALSIYHSLQLSLQKRFAKGMSFDVNYTWSKFLDDQTSSGWAGQGGSQVWQNAYTPLSNYGPSNNDVPQMFKGDFVYQLPGARDSGLLKRGSVLDAFLGGWQASTIWVWESGSVYMPLVGTTNNSGALAGNWYPNVVGNPSLSTPTLHQWFNTAAFAAPAAYTFGNAGRNILRGPQMSDLDFSMGKNFKFPKWEAGNLQLRFDATNVINHPSFSNPNANIGTSNAGIITGTSVGGRTLQLGARLSF